MAVFGDYAHYYNLLYRDKDYAAETDFILSVFKKNGLVPGTLLDLGCGTGRHGREMARRGIRVDGVDLSETMLAMGRAEQDKADGGSLPNLHQGDARSVRLGTTFDAVTSLFHVMSYQNTEEDAAALLRTAWAHLNPGGLFLFDFWYGPCVLSLRPEFRTKTMENESVHIERTARPSIDITKDLVTVHYDIAMLRKSTGECASFSEDHQMRYWFLPELRFLAGQAGFMPLQEGGWMRHDAPTDADWGAWILLEKLRA